MPLEPSIGEVIGARNSPGQGIWTWSLASACAIVLGGCIFGGSDGEPRAIPTLAGTVETAAASTLAPGVSATATVVPVSPDFVAADQLLREGRYSEARGAFRQVAAMADNPEARAAALVGLATAAGHLNHRDAVLAALEEAVASAPAGSPVGIRASYLLVKSLGEVGRYGDAVAVYLAGAEKSRVSPLGLYLGSEGAVVLAMAGRVVEADTLWALLVRDTRASSAFRASVYRDQARVARERRDLSRERSALEKLVLETRDPEARWQLAQVRDEFGDATGMVAELLGIVEGSPTSSYAGSALGKLVGLGVSVDPGQAGVVYYRRGAYSQAKAVLLPSIGGPGLSAGELAFRAYFLAASFEDSGDPASAVRYYDVAAESGANSVYVHRARYWAARVVEAGANAAEASRRYVQLVQGGPSGEFTEEAAFRAGYVLLRAGDTSSALTVWGTMQSGVSARLEYWRGRGHAQGGDVSLATAAYRRAMTLGPYEFHGLEAARELGLVGRFDAGYRERDLSQPVDWVVVEAWLRARVGGAPVVRERTAACELMSVGLREAAALELWGAARDVGAWVMFSVLREAKECGVTDVAAQLAVSLRIGAGVGSGEPPPDLLRVSYPVDFAESVRAEAKKAGIDPLFFAALIRQESLWDPVAGSTAGALGLTQVIPPTGFAIAAELGIVEFEAEDLFRPAVSLEFGAYYIGNQVKRYGDPFLALAAYNAGPANGARWGAAGATRVADLVEVIDFVETRTYVMYIYEAYAHYQLAWGD